MSRQTDAHLLMTKMAQTSASAQATALTSASASDNQKNNSIARCVTPSSSSSHAREADENDQQDSEDDDDIPHMLNPYSDQSDGDGDGDADRDGNVDMNYDTYHLDEPENHNLHHSSNHSHHVNPNKVSPLQTIRYRAESPQYWQLPPSSAYDVVDSSPVSSISNFSCDHNHAVTMSDDTIGSNNGIRRGREKEYVSSQQQQHQHQHQQQHRPDDFPISPSFVKQKHSLRVRLQPRMSQMYNTDNSTNDAHNVIQPRSSSPTNSQGSYNSSQMGRNVRGGSGHHRKGGREHHRFNGSECLPPPSPRGLSTQTRKKLGHRRSVSLNHIPSTAYYSPTVGHKRSMKGSDEMRLSTLKEGQQQQPTGLNHRIKSLSKPPISSHHLSHRRTVSFPDQVLQESTTIRSFGNHNVQRTYDDFMSQSDDPALFSLLETTQSKSNGRVCIPFDVDPSILMPSINSQHSVIVTVMNDKNFLRNEQQLMHPKKVDARHHARKHRRRKSGGSGSFSSTEQKLACLEEEGNLSPDDGNSCQLTKEDKKTPLQQLSGKVASKIKKSKHHQKYCQSKSASSEQTSSTEGKMGVKKKNDSKKKDKKLHKNHNHKLKTQDMHIQNDIHHEIDNPFLCGVGSCNQQTVQKKSSKKSKEACIVQ